MSTHQTAQTRYVVSPSGTKYAYRRLGTGRGTPLLVLTHFRGVMDRFDPAVLNGLASERQVITVDYAGVGLSTGEVATTVRQSADNILEFLSLIGETEVDVLGFSLGGMVAQLVALNADPARVIVRKLVLTGTTPSVGDGVQRSPNGANVTAVAGAQDVTLDTFKTLFFPKNREGDNAAEQWWTRIHEREALSRGDKEGATWLSQGYRDGAKGLKAQSNQLRAFFVPDETEGKEGSFARLADLKIPVLVANGHDDYMVPTANSFVMQQRLPNAQLIVYPNSGHGFLFQYADEFVRQVLFFLGQ